MSKSFLDALNDLLIHLSGPSTFDKVGRVSTK